MDQTGIHLIDKYHLFYYQQLFFQISLTAFNDLNKEYSKKSGVKPNFDDYGRVASGFD